MRLEIIGGWGGERLGAAGVGWEGARVKDGGLKGSGGSESEQMIPSFFFEDCSIRSRLP